MKGKLHFWVMAFILLAAAAILTTGMIAQADGDSPVNCPQGQGYWANHPEAWKVTSLMLGAQFYSQAELLAILPGGGGDASTILVVQLVSTKLSIAAGANGTPISAVMLQADALLAQYTGKLPYNVAPSSPAGQAMISLSELLDRYNSGQMTPNCAPTNTPSPTFTPSLTFTPTNTPTPGPSPTPTNTPTPGPSPTPTSTSPSAVTIIVEGPVQAINVNIITIYNININVNPQDTVLTHVHIGDFVRVEGNTVAGTTVLVVQAVNIFVVNVNTIVTNNNVVVWTDDGKNCNNAPPPWAPANGWRRRCENHPTTIIITGGGDDGGKGMGMGMGDDD